MKLDVAIVGGGLAGLLLARQLRRALPAVRVAVFEKAKEASFKVGESTVEVASNYLIRRLGLSRYLYERHLPKNGLRFFFDTPERDGDLEQLSEIGSTALPHLPSFQIDRARFETDLWEMNAQSGIEMIRGRVRRVELNDGPAPHRLEVDTDGRQLSVDARWVADASGRSSLIAKKLELREPEEHRLSAVWGRFRGVADLDDIGADPFRKRVGYTSRVLSTTHFCYPGYWIWFIPLGQGITSVGLVIERGRWKDDWRKAEGFNAFLREHRAVRELLEESALIDIMSYGQLAYGTSCYLSADRWALTGEAASFTDPFYSPGSDFIALGNDFITDLVRRDLGGEEQAALATRAQLYDELIRFRFDTTMKIYREQYGLLGSYELYRLKWDFDIACYYSLWLEPYLRDEHLDVDLIKARKRERPFVDAVMKNFADLFRRVEEHMREQGTFYERNLGQFAGDFPGMHCAAGLGSDVSSKDAIRRTGEAFNLTRRRALEMLGRTDVSDLPLTDFLSGRPLL